MCSSCGDVVFWIPSPTSAERLSRLVLSCNFLVCPFFLLHHSCGRFCSSVVQTNISKTTFLFASKRFLGTFLPWWLPSWLKAKPQVEKPIVTFHFVGLRSCSLNFPLFFFQKSEHLFFFTFHFSISLLSFLSDSAASLAPAQLSAGSSLTTRMTD